MRNLLIFDLDGTLLDTIEDLGHAVNAALTRNGLPEHAMSEYYRMVGGGVRNLVRRALPDSYKEDDLTAERVLDDFFVFYRASIDKFTKPYPGIIDLLARLQSEKYLMAVASNKFQDGVSSLIGKFFPETVFISVFGNRPQAPLKPSPQIVEDIMAKCGGPVKAVMIGDSGVDIETAKAAGIPVIAVSWGFRSREELSEADTIVDNAQQLYDAIKNLSIQENVQESQ